MRTRTKTQGIWELMSPPGRRLPELGDRPQTPRKSEGAGTAVLQERQQKAERENREPPAAQSDPLKADGEAG